MAPAMIPPTPAVRPAGKAPVAAKTAHHQSREIRLALRTPAKPAAVGPAQAPRGVWNAGSVGAYGHKWGHGAVSSW